MLENKDKLELKEKLILEKLYEWKAKLDQIISKNKENKEEWNIVEDIWDEILEGVWEFVIDTSIDIILEWFKQWLEVIMRSYNENGIRSL